MSTSSFETFLQYAREPEFDLIVKRLAAYSAYRLAGHGAALRLMDQPLDYVNEAIRLVLDGTRHLPADVDRPAIFHALCGVVDSLIGHHREKIERRGPHISIVAPGINRQGDDIPEDQLAHVDPFDEEVIARETLDRFLAALEPDLGGYVRARVVDRDRTAIDHARILCIPVAEVRNMDRRLMRRRNLWSSATGERIRAAE